MDVQVNGFKTSILVCDGASSNLSVIKASHGCHGMYGVSPGKDPYKIKPWFVNPYDPLSHIYWLICPSHQVNKWLLVCLITKIVFQLKNMINALFSSRSGGARMLFKNCQEFGWQAISDMYARECARRDDGHARMVPKLKEAYILRDS